MKRVCLLRLPAVAFAILLGVICGCAGPSLLVARPQPLDLPARTKSNIPVRLVITPALRVAKWVDANREGWEIPEYDLGDALATHSAEVMRALFSDVKVVDGDAKGRSDRLVVEPRVVDIEQNRPLWRWDERTITISYEWSVRRPDGKLLWVDTIVANGTNRLEDPDKERVALLMEHLFSKSFKALATAIDAGRLVAR